MTEQAEATETEPTEEECIARFGRTQYKRWWNRHTRGAVLAIRLFWAFALGLALALLVGVASVGWEAHGGAFAAGMLMAAGMIWSQIARLDSVGKLLKIASHAIRVRTPQGMIVVLYGASGEICRGDDLLGAPWGFPREYCESELSAGSDVVAYLGKPS